MLVREVKLLSFLMQLSVRSSFSSDSHPSRFSTISILFNARFKYSKYFKRRTFSTQEGQRQGKKSACSHPAKQHPTYFRNLVCLKVDIFQTGTPEVNVLNFTNVLLMKGDLFWRENFSLLASNLFQCVSLNKNILSNEVFQRANLLPRCAPLSCVSTPA